MDEKTRPTPSAPLILNVSGDSLKSDRVEAIHNGMQQEFQGSYDMPSIYPYLNFNEYLAFAAGAWKMRAERKTRVEEMAAGHPSRTRLDEFVLASMYEPFEDGHLALEGFNHFMKELEEKNPGHFQKLRKMNPYDPRTLSERVDKYGLEQIGDSLFLEALVYVPRTKESLPALDLSRDRWAKDKPLMNYWAEQIAQRFRRGYDHTLRE